MNRKTNDEFVRDLMTFSRRGALIQIFVLQALVTFSREVLLQYEDGRLTAQMDDHPLIHPDAWVDCAREILEKMSAQYETGNNNAANNSNSAT